MELLTLFQISARVGMKAARGLVFAAAFALVPVTQAAQQLTEYDIKAVFLLNFTRFIEWPAAGEAAPGQPLVIGVMGDDPFGRRLDEAVRGEKVNNRLLTVKRINNLQQARECAAVFIARSEKHRVAEILRGLRGAPVLTVSDIPEFAEAGGMVGLVSDQGKIRLHINVEVAKAAQLAISSKLLRPAQIVSTRKTTQFNRPFDLGLLAKKTEHRLPFPPRR
jgi:hypothetical protein